LGSVRNRCGLELLDSIEWSQRNFHSLIAWNVIYWRRLCRKDVALLIDWCSILRMGVGLLLGNKFGVGIRWIVNLTVANVLLLIRMHLSLFLLIKLPIVLRISILFPSFPKGNMIESLQRLIVVSLRVDFNLFLTVHIDYCLKFVGNLCFLQSA
jgi:hypothetical protein